MVSALDSGSSGPGSRPGRGHCRLCSCARHLTLAVPLSNQVYEWVPANLMLGVNLRWTSIPSREEQKYSQSLHAMETGISSGLVNHLAYMQTMQTCIPFLSLTYFCIYLQLLSFAVHISQLQNAFLIDLRRKPSINCLKQAIGKRFFFLDNQRLSLHLTISWLVLLLSLS